MKPDILIRGGNLVLPNATCSGGSVTIRNGVIEQILTAQEPCPAADIVVDATGKFVFPGVVDAHVHVETSGPETKPLGVYADDFDSMSRAAAFGGVTTVVPFVFANGLAHPRDYVRDVIAVAERDSWVDFSLHFGIARSADVDAIASIADLGIRSFKVLMAYKQGGSMISDALLATAMHEVARCSGIMMVHAEDGELIDALEKQAIASGETDPPSYACCRPAAAEEIAILRALALANRTGCKLYVVHLSTEDGLNALKQARRRGQKVLLETCPQYLMLTADELLPDRLGPLAKIGPPLRQDSDREALWSAIDDSTLDVIGSDHAPRHKERKLTGLTNIFAAPFGGPGLETLLPVLFDEFRRRTIPLTVLARLLAEAPARTFGLYPQKGAIAIGSDADLVIFDPDATWTVDPERFETNAKYSVFAGRRIVGKPVSMFVRGRPILVDGILASAGRGHGHFIPYESNTSDLALSFR